MVFIRNNHAYNFKCVFLFLLFTEVYHFLLFTAWPSFVKLIQFGAPSNWVFVPICNLHPDPGENPLPSHTPHRLLVFDHLSTLTMCPMTDVTVTVMPLPLLQLISAPALPYLLSPPSPLLVIHYTAYCLWMTLSISSNHVCVPGGCAVNS